MSDQEKSDRRTLAEFHAALKAEGKWDEFQAMRKAKSEELAKRKAELDAAQAPLVEALRATGLDVNSVWNLVNTAEPYPEAVPVLFEHLYKPYPERIVEGILRALAVPDSRPRWPELLDLFEKYPSQATSGLRWAAGCALSASADDEVIGEVMRIVADPRYGFERLAFLDVLARSNNARAKMMLHELRDDPVLGKEIKKQRRMNRLSKKKPSP